MPGAGAGVTVIIPSHGGRSRLVARLLDSLQVAALWSPLSIETIVVDCSREPEASVLEGECRRPSVSYVRGPRSAGRKRNIGAAAARFDHLLFIDSDCRATPGLLAEHLAVLRTADDGVAASVGPTRMYGAASAWRWRVAEHSRMYNQCYDFARQYREVLWGTTSNLCFRRSAFEQVGGFDERALTAVGGEDVDIGVRARRAGYRIVTAPEAWVEHARDHVRALPAIARSLFVYGRADVYLMLAHPERKENHVNAIAGLLAVGLLAAASRQVTGRGAPLMALGGLAAVLGSVARDRRRVVYSLASEARTRRWTVYDIAAGVAAAWLDSSFDAGALTEAFRQRRPDLVLRRFRYIDADTFKPAAVTPH